METEMESQLRGVSSGQPQLFAEIAQCHDLRALPEQKVELFWLDTEEDRFLQKKIISKTHFFKIFLSCFY
jgi:hypothetical protein